MNCPSCGHPLDGTPAVCPDCWRPVEYRDVPVLDTPEEIPASPWAPPREPDSVADPEEPAAPVVGDTEPASEPTAAREPAAELPSGGFGDPRQYLAATHQPAIRQYPLPSVDPVGTAWADPAGGPAAGPRRRLAVPIVLVALGLAVAGGVTAAGFSLGWFGRGPQPSDVMPSATAAYVQIDLDPSLSQKSQAWTFLRDLPQVREAVAAGQPDPKRMIWDALVRATGFVGETDYDAEVAPWLGSRVGFGAVGHDRPAGLMAIQVTDEEAAAAKLRSWISSRDADLDVTLRDGFALVTNRADTAGVLGDLADGNLSSNEAFRSDLNALGDTGVLAGWADLGALARQGAWGAGAAGGQGRVAVALRFTADTLALDGRFFDAGPTATEIPGVGAIGELPGSSAIAVSVSGGADTLKQVWSELPGGLEDALKDSGADEADLEAVLGRNLTLAAPATTVSGVLGEPGSGTATAGARITTDDVARARTVLRKLTVADGAGVRLFDHADGDVLTVATSQDYLAELVDPAERLSGYAPFTKAVPDHARAAAAAYLNLAPFVARGEDFGEYGDFVGSLRSFGAEIVPGQAGAGSWSIRLVRS